MKTLCIFNPEHDLCLANGSRNYMPPASALDFARKSAHLMGYLYPGAECVCIDQFQVPAEPYQIIPWGWDLVLRQSLIKAGVPENILPSETRLAELRTLQHRGTALPLQEDVVMCRNEQEVEAAIRNLGRAVLKSPLSGSGRGLRWIEGPLQYNDNAWIARQLQHHGCVMVEPWRKVVENFALEYEAGDESVHFVGYSLFDTQNGVYRGNWMLSDEEIHSRLGSYVGPALVDTKTKIEQYLVQTVLGRYQGPLGVDLMLCEEDGGYTVQVSEINFRHTMGLVAHAINRQHLAAHGTLWSPEVK